MVLHTSSLKQENGPRAEVTAFPSLDEWIKIIPRVHDLLWVPLMEEARLAGKAAVEVELGPPHAIETIAYYAASEFFLTGRGIAYCPALVPEMNGEPARLLLRILL